MLHFPHEPKPETNYSFFTLQALSAASLPTSSSASIAGTFAPALASPRLLSRHNNNSSQRSFSADAAAVAPPPDDPSPPPPPPPPTSGEASKPPPPTATAPSGGPAFGEDGVDDDEGPDASLTPRHLVDAT